ncbi:hypothetical protein SBY92_001679 [Candida maltosa Xu316]
MISAFFSTYPYYSINLVITSIFLINHLIYKNYQLTFLTLWNLIIISYTPLHSLNLSYLPLYDVQIFLMFLTSVVISYTSLKQENKKSVFNSCTYIMSFITILIFSTTFIPENMLLNSTSSIFGSVKFDYVFIALTVTYLVDAITKFAFISDFPTILVQGIWTYNAVIIAIAMWFMIYSKDTLVNILTIMENGIDKQDTSFMTSVIISNLNQLEQDYKICSQGTLTMQKCLSERNMDNLQTTFQIAKIMAINCWSILSLFCFVLTPSIIFFIYKRRELLEEDKVLDEKEVMV